LPLALVTHSSTRSAPRNEAADPQIAWNPGDPVKQLAGIGFKCRHELEERVESGKPFAVLQLADLGSVKGGAKACLLLGEVDEAAAAFEVFAEALGNVFRRRHQFASNRSK
jgi:hypothetical protein